MTDIGEDKPELLEADFTIHANDEFHRISQEVFEKEGKSDPDKIYSEWEDWLTKAIKEYGK